MKEITSIQEFNELVKGNQPLLIDFYADWCGPCQKLLPVVDNLSKEYAGRVNIVKVNVDNLQDLASKLQVRSIPALFFIKDQKVVKRVVGLQTSTSLSKELDNLIVFKNEIVKN